MIAILAARIKTGILIRRLIIRKVGRSLKDKTPVRAVKGLVGNIRTEVIPDVTTATVKPIIEKWVEKGSIMISDE